METATIMTLTEALTLGTEVLTWLLSAFALIINFVLSHWLTILGVILFIVVMALSSVRRFY